MGACPLTRRLGLLDKSQSINSLNRGIIPLVLPQPPLCPRTFTWSQFLQIHCDNCRHSQALAACCKALSLPGTCASLVLSQAVDSALYVSYMSPGFSQVFQCEGGSGAVSASVHRGHVCKCEHEGARVHRLASLCECVLLSF